MNTNIVSFSSHEFYEKNQQILNTMHAFIKHISNTITNKNDTK